jgi:hypothetical protein
VSNRPTFFAARRAFGGGRIPKYGLHKPSGLAVVYLDRRPVYLGKHGSKESYERYRQLLAEHGTVEQRRLPVLSANDPVSVALLVEQYLVHAVEHYGQHHEYLSTIKAAIAPLLELHASTTVANFGPRALQAVRAPTSIWRSLQRGLLTSLGWGVDLNSTPAWIMSSRNSGASLAGD